MFNESEFSRNKRIKEMVKSEVGFLHLGALFYDENGDEWMNLNAYVSKDYREFSLVLLKLSDKINDYEIVTSESVLTANADTHYFGFSDEFERTDFMIKTQDFLHHKKPKSKEVIKEEMNIKKEILSPLQNVFFDADILKEVLIKTSVPQVIQKKEPEFPGVILHGPPGTGKTELAKSIFKIFKNADCVTEELNLAEMSEQFVGSLAHNLDDKLSNILKESDKEYKPAYVFLDEATSLVMSSNNRGSVKDYYQEAIDVLKKYISNYPNLVFVISTNLIEDFDTALIREGRLTLIEINLPKKEQQQDMWRYFIKKYDILKKLTKIQCLKITEAAAKESGAFISNFCMSYISIKKLSMEENAGKSFVDVLISGEAVDTEEFKKTLKFKTVLEDVKILIEKKYEGIKSTKKKPVGFGLKVK